MERTAEVAFVEGFDPVDAAHSSGVGMSSAAERPALLLRVLSLGIGRHAVGCLLDPADVGILFMLVARGILPILAFRLYPLARRAVACDSSFSNFPGRSLASATRRSAEVTISVLVLLVSKRQQDDVRNTIIAELVVAETGERMGMNGKAWAGLAAASVVGALLGASVGGYYGFRFGSASIIDQCEAKDAKFSESLLSELRDLRGGATRQAIETIESRLDDQLIMFDPQQPYPVSAATASAVAQAIQDSARYRTAYPRKSSRPYVDAMVSNLLNRSAHR